MISLKNSLPRLIPSSLERREHRDWDKVLGMNARNGLIEYENSSEAIRLVNDKYATKLALTAKDIPVTPTITLIRDRLEFRAFDWTSLPDAWALKPNCGKAGAGILLAKERDADGEGWRTGSGRLLSVAAITEHIHLILEGEFSMGGMEADAALFEPLILAHETLGELVPYGLPDIRVICYHGEPVLAMTRLPTEASEGKANLHQNAVGAGIDLETGQLTRAFHGGRDIVQHPDTARLLNGVQIPSWETILAAARRCGEATELGFLGVDVVIDRERGPLVIEVNAHPGLEIQNVTKAGLKELLARPRPKVGRYTDARSKHAG